MKAGDKVIITEETPDGIFKWQGEVTQVTEAFVETKHARNRDTHPQWKEFDRAYLYTWIKHYFHPDGKTNLDGIMGNTGTNSK